MKKIRIIFLIPLFLSACVSPRYIAIETLQPSKFTFEGDKDNIAICAKQNILSESISSNESAKNIQPDSMIRNILYSVQELLEDVYGYENTRFRTFLLKAGEQPPNYNNFDMVLEMDVLQINCSYYAQEYSYYDWEAYLQAQYATRWSIRNSSGEQINAFNDQNMIVWNSGLFPTKSEAVENLPRMKDAWWDLGIESAKKYVAYIAPQWSVDGRTIYMINRFPEQSMLAYTAMKEDDFQQAHYIWDTMLASCRNFGQKEIKSRINHNIAVVCEFQNKLEEAIDWAQKSLDVKRQYTTIIYLNVLKRRETDMIILDRQTKRQ